MGKKQRRPLPSLDLKRLSVYSIRTRKHLVDVRDFSTPIAVNGSTASLLSSLPNIYAGKDLKVLIRSLVDAHRGRRHVVAAIGGHVIKCGLSPLLIDLMKRGVITAVALNGGAAIHDFEISLIGRTSEDVAESLGDGRFGMARETAEGLAKAVEHGAQNGIGLGRALGELIRKQKHLYRHLSLLATAAELDIPGTVHVAVGTDIVHMHSALSGASLGKSSLNDFRIFTSVVAALERGVYLNIGSAVIMPEVFLKALSIARNLHRKPRVFTTANLDMIQHYRPRVNVLGRPGGRSIAITGHHEILLPLIRAGILVLLKGHRIR